MNTSEIRVLQFNQGVGVATPPNSADVASKQSLANNATTAISGLSYDYNRILGLYIDYFIYRRTDAGFKWSTGRLFITALLDQGLGTPWNLHQPLLTEFNDPGVTFSINNALNPEFELNVTLDNMAGANHSAVMRYKVSTFPV